MYYVLGHAQEVRVYILYIYIGVVVMHPYIRDAFTVGPLFGSGRLCSHFKNIVAACNQWIFLFSSFFHFSLLDIFVHHLHNRTKDTDGDAVYTTKTLILQFYQHHITLWDLRGFRLVGICELLLCQSPLCLPSDRPLPTTPGNVSSFLPGSTSLYSVVHCNSLDLVWAVRCP